MDQMYFDHNATTPLAGEVADVYTDCLRSIFGNASSIHRNGQEAKQALELSRRKISSAINGIPSDLVFGSGGSELNNLAILGLARPTAQKNFHVITTGIEHPSVLEPIREMERQGVQVTYLPVNQAGLIDLTELRKQIRPDTMLISVMHANNEVGTVQPISQVAAILREYAANGQKIYLHSDGVQAFGKIPVDVQLLGVDLYTFSAHKIYGPKGIGALYVRKGTPLQPTQLGGRQERGRRPGTENVPGAMAFARAAELVTAEVACSELTHLRDYFESQLLQALPEVAVNGANARRVPNTSSVYFDGVEGEALVISLDLKGFCVSTGSACASGSIEPSHVLMAMGLSERGARSCVRFSFGRTNTKQQVDALLEAVVGSVSQLRSSKRKKLQYAET